MFQRGATFYDGLGKLGIRYHALTTIENFDESGCICSVSVHFP